jgi:hypothetical protein
MIGSFSLRPSAGDSALQTLCHASLREFVRFYSTLEEGEENFVRNTRLGHRAESGIPDRISAPLAREAGFPRF